MTARTKIDVHARTLSMEFGDTLLQFNIFVAMKHPTEDHSLFGIDRIYELVEEYFQLDSHSEDIDNFAKKTGSIGCLGSILEEETNHAVSREVHNLSNFVDNNNDIADLDFEAEFLEVLDQVCKHQNLECFTKVEVQQLLAIIANNLHQEQEDKLLQVLRQHKKAIGLKLSDLPGINPAIYMHRILMEEATKPIRQ
ncbi:hypothetical protein CR513_42171, partial [Mucuna pruriens]